MPKFNQRIDYNSIIDDEENNKKEKRNIGCILVRN